MTLAISLFSALVACGGAGSQASGPSAADLDAAVDLVHPMQPWGDAEKALKDKLGEPATNDAAAATWVVHTETACKTLTVAKMGDSAGGASVADGPCP